MKKQPLLSINIPTYNRVDYLKQALEALLPQISDEVEINVSDNHSTDDTWNYLGSLAGKVNRIKPPLNTNANHNILSCLSLGTGEYTWIHCDDDIAQLNAADNIVHAIKEFNLPPVLSFDWDGFDVNMTGFVNRCVVAKWKRCDRNEFLRSISYKFTFASAIIVKRGCADLDYITSHAPLNLIPGNIMFSTVGKFNDVVVSEVPLLAARGNPGNYDALTTFSKDTWQLFRMNHGLGYEQPVLQRVYSDSLKNVVPFAAQKCPVYWKGVWNVTFYSVGYKNFYNYVLPVLARRLTPKPLSKIIKSLRNGVAQCWRRPRNWIRKFAHWVIWSLVRKALSAVTASHGEEGYARICGSLDEIAKKFFISQVSELELPAHVRHPVYLKNPKYFRIGKGFVAGPGLRIEAWDSFEGDSFSPRILIGNHVGLNWNVHIGAIDRVEIHDNVLIGSNVLITDHSHGKMIPEECEQPPRLRRLSSKGPVVIEENVWIGENVSILPNVTIGRGAVIGANSVVTENVPAYTVMGGVPARVLKHLR